MLLKMRIGAGFDDGVTGVAVAPASCGGETAWPSDSFEKSVAVAPSGSPTKLARGANGVPMLRPPCCEGTWLTCGGAIDSFEASVTIAPSGSPAKLARAASGLAMLKPPRSCGGATNDFAAENCCGEA